jgi:hypothetical protein
MIARTGRALFTKSTQTTQSPPFAKVLPFIVKSLAKVV